MRPRCRRVLQRLVEASTGSVPPQERAGIAEHLAACDRCRAEAVAIEGTAARLRGAGPFTVPPGFWEEFTDRLQARIARERQPWTVRTRRWITSPPRAWGALAATAAAALIVTAAVWLGPSRPAAPDPVTLRARGLVTETMTTTLPSLTEMLETWRAGLMVEIEGAADRRGP